MSHPVLEKYRDLRVLKDQASVDALWKVMIAADPLKLESWFARSPHAGRVIMVMDDNVAPGKILEYVPDIADDTSVTTLYDSCNQIFATRQSLVDAREEIIAAIDHRLMSVPNTATVMDCGRDNKHFTLPELGTAQLLDTLAILTGSMRNGI
jgi:hypothetical protein